MKPVLGVGMGLVLLLSVHTRGLEQQRAVPCWKVQPEKRCKRHQRGMNAALESCCEPGASIKGVKKPQTKPQLPLLELQSREQSCSWGLLCGCSWGCASSLSDMWVSLQQLNSPQPPLAPFHPVCLALFGSINPCFRARPARVYLRWFPCAGG